MWVALKEMGAGQMFAKMLCRRCLNIAFSEHLENKKLNQKWVMSPEGPAKLLSTRLLMELADTWVSPFHTITSKFYFPAVIGNSRVFHKGASLGMASHQDGISGLQRSGRDKTSSPLSGSVRMGQMAPRTGPCRPSSTH